MERPCLGFPKCNRSCNVPCGSLKSWSPRVIKRNTGFCAVWVGGALTPHLLVPEAATEWSRDCFKDSCRKELLRLLCGPATVLILLSRRVPRRSCGVQMRLDLHLRGFSREYCDRQGVNLANGVKYFDLEWKRGNVQEWRCSSGN